MANVKFEIVGDPDNPVWTEAGVQLLRCWFGGPRIEFDGYLELGRCEPGELPDRIQCALEDVAHRLAAGLVQQVSAMESVPAEEI